VTTDRKLLWTLLLLAATLLGWTAAIGLETDWVATGALAAASVLLVLIWFRWRGRKSEQPPL
jgi:membrane protein implicated in regulation of membrane protease activity